ncbi:unnamed protein product, partial [Rangifer tarandus platyrhynchus]
MTVVPALGPKHQEGSSSLELKAATCCKGTERTQIDTFTKPRRAQCLLQQLTLTHAPTLNREFVFVAKKTHPGKSSAEKFSSELQHKPSRFQK